MAFISVFDVLGPNMIGPSSSHTAGSSAKYNAGHKNAFNRYPGAFRSAYLCSTM